MLLAWKRIAANYPSLDVDFVGQPQKMLLNATPVDGGLLQFEKVRLLFAPVKREGGTIRPADYDALVIAACSYGPIAVMNLYREMSFFGLNRKSPNVMSRDRFMAAARYALNATAAMHICGLWRQQSDKPILLVPNPLPSEAGFHDQQQLKMRIWQLCRESADEETLLALFSGVTAELEVKLGFTFIPQAELTRQSAISTKAAYCENAVSVLNPQELAHAEDDYFHMNDAYGEAMWKEIAVALG